MEIIQYIPIIIYVVAGFFVAVGFFRGVSRRLGRSIISLMMAVVAAGITLFGLRYVISALGDSANVNSLLDTLRSNATTADIAEKVASVQSELPDVFSLALALPLSLSLPMCFFGVFTVVSIVTGIVYLILALILFPRRKNVLPFSRLLGGVVGAAKGAFVALLVLSPIIGYCSMVSSVTEVTDPAFADNQTYVDTVEIINACTEPVLTHPVTKIARLCQSDKLFSYLTTFDFKTENGEKVVVKMEQEIGQYASIATHVLQLKGANVEALTTEQINAIKALADDVSQSKVSSILVSGVLSKACTAWENGETFFGKAKPTVGDSNTQNIIDTAIATFKDSTPDTAAEDLRSVAELFEVMAKYDALSSFDDPDKLYELLTNDELIGEALAVLKENDRLAEVAKETVKTGVQLVVESTVDETTFNEVVEALNEATADKLNTLAAMETTEEREAAVTDAITDVLETYEITEGAAVVEFVASLLVEDFAEQIDSGEVTAEDIASYLGLYAK